MRVTYCCDGRAYEKYYLSQVGHGMPYFSGASYQRGYGLGSIFSSIAKSVLPLIKSGAKAVGKEALKSGMAFASDVVAGKNVKQAAIDRAKSAGSNLFQAAKQKARSNLFRDPRVAPVKRKKKNPARVQKKKRKKHNDIFS